MDNLKFQSKNEKLREKELRNAFKLKIEKDIIENTQYSSMGCSINGKENVIYINKSKLSFKIKDKSKTILENALNSNLMLLMVANQVRVGLVLLSS